MIPIQRRAAAAACLCAVAIADGVLGYLFAYTFYFLFISTGSRTKHWMRVGLLVIALYVLGTGYLTYVAARRIVSHPCHLERM